MLISGVASSQVEPAAAAGADNFLAVWTDRREEDADVRAALVSTDGAPRVLPVPVCSRPTVEQTPALAFGDGVYFVAWQDFRTGQPDIFAARVGTDGALRDSLGFAVADSPFYEGDPSVGFDGVNFLAAWVEQRAGDILNVRARRFAPDGTAVDPSPFLITDTGYDHFLPDVAFGRQYLVVWSDERAGPAQRHIFACRVTADGAVLDTAAIAVSEGPVFEDRPAVAADGEDFLVVWEDRRTGDATPSVFARRVSGEGGKDGPAFMVASASRGCRAPDAAFDGTQYVIAWQDGTDSLDHIWACFVDTSGAVGTAFSVSASPDSQCTPRVACAPGSPPFFAFAGFVPSPFGSVRALGNFYPPLAVEERRPRAPAPSVIAAPTIFTGGHVRLCAPAGTSALEVFDRSGRMVVRLPVVTFGNRAESVWDARDAAGRRVGPGVYFVRVPGAAPAPVAKLVFLGD